VGHGGTVAAVAGHKRVHFLDSRRLGHDGGAAASSQGLSPGHSTPSPWLGCYKDAHSDRVTSVLFVGDTPALLSGGEDGLVSVFDTSKPSEAEALQTAWNVGSPVRRVGIAGVDGGEAGDLVWCLTGNETLGLWNPETDAALGFPDLRRDLAATGSALPAPEYLVDARWDGTSRSLLLAAGNATGDACVYRLSLGGAGGVTSQESPPSQSPSHQDPRVQAAWEPIHVLTGGHRGVVRSWVRCSDGVTLTAGEDARLCEWSTRPLEPHQQQPRLASSAPHPPPRGSAGAGGGGPVRRQRSRPNLGPY
jgi:WD40 repeat protein